MSSLVSCRDGSNEGTQHTYALFDKKEKKILVSSIIWSSIVNTFSKLLSIFFFRRKKTSLGDDSSYDVAVIR